VDNFFFTFFVVGSLLGIQGTSTHPETFAVGNTQNSPAMRTEINIAPSEPTPNFMIPDHGYFTLAMTAFWMNFRLLLHLNHYSLLLQLCLKFIKPGIPIIRVRRENIRFVWQIIRLENSSLAEKYDR